MHDANCVFGRQRGIEGCHVEASSPAHKQPRESHLTGSFHERTLIGVLVLGSTGHEF